MDMGGPMRVGTDGAPIPFSIGNRNRSIPRLTEVRCSKSVSAPIRIGANAKTRISFTPVGCNRNRMSAIEPSSTHKALVVLQGAGHLVFVNQVFGMTDQAWDMERAHALINHFAAAFLRAVLYQDEPAGAALLPAAAGRFDGVLYDRAWPR